MADPDFETRLIRLFAQAPEFVDSDGFAQRVESRLDRSWTVRRLLIGAAGVGGGAIAVAQTIGAHLFDRVAGFSGASVAAFSQGARTLSQLPLVTALPIGGEVMWVGAGLAVLAVVLVATRALENL
jgi:hypothetical protein